MSASQPVFRTLLCDLLGIDYPILQSGMGGIAGPDLAAQVSEAGGLGIIAAISLTADELRKAIRQLRSLTNKPFGVNLLLPPELRPPQPSESIPQEMIQAVQSVLNTIRPDLGLPPCTDRPPTFPDLVPETFQVILDERVPVFSVGLGNPGAEMVAACHKRGIKVIAMVTTSQDAQAVEAAGLDAVVAQGAEAGGHRSHFDKPSSSDQSDSGTVVLVPEIVDAVRIPVIAAGGIVDGRGLVSALSLGASGVLMGSRFVLTQESTAAEHHKKAMLESASNTTVVTDVFSGRFARAFRNRFTEVYNRSKAPVLPFPSQALIRDDIGAEAVRQDNSDYLPLWSGQGTGLMHDLPRARDIVEETIAQARHILLNSLPQSVTLDP